MINIFLLELIIVYQNLKYLQLEDCLSEFYIQFRQYVRSHHIKFKKKRNLKDNCVRSLFI